MKPFALILCLLFASSVCAEDVEFYRQKLAIARAKLALATPAEASGDSTPVTPMIEAPDAAPPLVRSRQVWKQTGTRKQCINGVCSRVPVYGWVTEQVPVVKQSLITQSDSAADYATPLPAAKRMLEYMRSVSGGTLLDLGSGDGRMVVEWARWTGYPAIGIESDPDRVALSRAFAERKGVSHLATILEADYTAMAHLPAAKIVYVYQMPADLAVIRDKLTRYDLVVSYMHEVPGLSMTSHNGGEFYSWQKPKPQPVTRSVPSVKYGNRWYTRPVCNKPGCSMCNKIRAMLAAQGAY